MARKKRPFAGETAAERVERASEIAKRLSEGHPDAGVALRHTSPLELMVSTILSAQCTDERVNSVTPELFKRFQAVRDYADADTGELEEMIRPTGFFRQKAKSIQGACSAIAQEHGGEVPREMDALTSLPGVGRKTANCIRGGAWGIPGITVDTHVKRLSRRLGLTDHTDPVKIEYDLNELLPEEIWYEFSNAMIFHGRRVCDARRPDCPNCMLSDLCRFYHEEYNDQKAG
ncbi:MAG: endonuclease III [Candidatus Latescibacteria bacterium]|nr:endonuclease III [Candidatus Latescibacterota bacterium]